MRRVATIKIKCLTWRFHCVHCGDLEWNRKSARCYRLIACQFCNFNNWFLKILCTKKQETKKNQTQQINKDNEYVMWSTYWSSSTSTSFNHSYWSLNHKTSIEFNVKLMCVSFFYFFYVWWAKLLKTKSSTEMCRVMAMDRWTMTFFLAKLLCNFSCEQHWLQLKKATHNIHSHLQMV